MKNQGFTKYETILGLAVISISILVFLPPLIGGVEKDRPVMARCTAERIARAVLDYHTDTGGWPLTDEGRADLARLTQRTLPPCEDTAGRIVGDVPVEELVATIGSGGAVPAGYGHGTDERPWLQEIPLDPWHRPYEVVVLGDCRGEAAVDRFDSARIYPRNPPTGVAIVAISAGPNGFRDTNTALWRGEDPAADLARYGGIQGDDIGFVLTRTCNGGG